MCAKDGVQRYGEKEGMKSMENGMSRAFFRYFILRIFPFPIDIAFSLLSHIRYMPPFLIFVHSVARVSSSVLLDKCESFINGTKQNFFSIA